MNTRLNVCDLNAIETRVGAYIAQCQPLLDVFTPRPGRPNGLDPYLAFTTNLTGKSYDILERDMKSLDKMIKKAVKDERQMGKVGVLGCIYRMGGGDWGIDWKTKDTIKTGMWGYAEGYGVKMERDQAHKIVMIFREVYKEIPDTWYLIEKCIEAVLKGVKVKREIGPNGCIKFDKLTINQDDIKRHILRIHLPSGRCLHYMDAEMMSAKMPWKNRDGGDVYRDSFCYSGVDQDTHQWKMGIQSHGGKVFENIVQAFARDILAVKLLMFEKIGIEICGHVHDEGIGRTKNDPFAPGVLDMISLMSQEVSWAPGLPLGADGFEGPVYHK